MKKKILSALFALAIVISTIPFVTANAGSYVKRTVSQTGVNFIEVFEGYFQYAYWDYEHYTIGYGTTCTKNEYPAGISQEAASELLKKVLPSYESGLNSFLKSNDIYVTQNQYDALVSFTYNFGAYVWNREPTIAKYLKNGINKYTDKQIADAFGLWVKAGGVTIEGLVERRAAEAKLFCTDDFSAVQEIYVLANDTTVRKGAGTGYGSVGSLAKGKAVSVLAKKYIGTSIWGEISYGGENRWLSITSAKFGQVETSSDSLYRPCLYKVENVSTGIQLKWTKVDTASGYKIYRKRSDSGSFSLYKTITSKSTLSFTDKSVVSSYYYVYCIKSYNSSKDSGKSGNSSIYFVTAPLLKSTSRLSNGIKINWYARSDASGYYVMRRPSSDSNYSRVATVSSSTTSYSDTKAVGGIKYYYSIKAYNSKGVSGSRDGLSNKYVAAPVITSSYNSKTSLKITWKKSINSDGYYVYRKTSSSGSYKKVATIKKGSTTSYTDKNVSASHTYYYSIRAYDSDLTSAYGERFTAKMITPPSIKAVAKHENGLKVTWNEKSAATSYQVYRKVKGGSYSLVATVDNSKEYYVDTKVTTGKTYYYKIAVIQGSCRSYTGTEKSATFYASTKITSATAVSNGLKIAWTKKSNATSYSLYKKVDGKYKLVETVTGGWAIDKNVTKAGKHLYRVVVNYKGGKSAQSTTYKAYKLNRPTLKLSVTSSYIKLDWSKVSYATGYIIYRKDPDSSSYKQYATVGIEKTSFDNSTVVAKKKYSYKVKAIRGKNYSIASSAATATAK